MSNFIPKSVFKIKNQDGSTSSAEEWNFGDLGSGILSGTSISTIFCLLFFLPIASPILLILYILKTTGKTIVFNILGIMTSLYFVFDCYHNWLVSEVINLSLNDTVIYFLISLNIGAILAHTILLILGFTNDLKKSVSTSIITISIIIGLMLGNNLKSSNIFIERNKERVNSCIGNTRNYDGKKKTELEKEQDQKIELQETYERQRKQKEDAKKERDED